MVRIALLVTAGIILGDIVLVTLIKVTLSWFFENGQREYVERLWRLKKHSALCAAGFLTTVSTHTVAIVAPASIGSNGD